MHKTRIRYAVAFILIVVFATCGVLLATRQNSTSNTDKIAVQSLKPIGTPTLSEKTAVFNNIWSLFNENYPDFQEKVIDWSAEKAIYEPKALGKNTWAGFFQVVNDMISTLHDVHCGLIGAPLPQEYSPLLLTAFHANQLVVIASPDNAVVRPGMIVLGIDGKPLTDVLQSSNSDWFEAPDYQLQSLFDTSKDAPETVTFEDPKTHAVQAVKMPVFTQKELSHLWSVFSKSHPGYMYDPQFQLLSFSTESVSAQIASLSSPSDVIFHQLGHGILYIRIPLMTDTLQAQIQARMKEILNAKGLIIDLRDDPGGRSAPGTWFAEHMYEQTEVPLIVRTYHDDSFSNWGGTMLPPVTPHITAPTAVLINGGDVSSAEMFTAQLESAPNVKTFGARTFGGDGNPHIYPVMYGISIKIPSWQEIIAATGQPIEQVGIAPDQFVAWSMPQVQTYMRSLQDDSNPYASDPVVQAGERWILSR